MSTLAAAGLVALGLLALRRVRWAYLGFVVLAVLWIPARTRFRLRAPECDLAITLENAAGSLTNIAHVMLFGVFFAVTVVQFGGSSASRIVKASAATLLFGATIELMQGATRTGNCQLHDLLPDGVAVILAAGLVVLWDRVSRAVRKRTDTPG